MALSARLPTCYGWEVEDALKSVDIADIVREAIERQVRNVELLLTSG